jgi:hypothetical protein
MELLLALLNIIPVLESSHYQSAIRGYQYLVALGRFLYISTRVRYIYIYVSIAGSSLAQHKNTEVANSLPLSWLHVIA